MQRVQAVRAVVAVAFVDQPHRRPAAVSAGEAGVFGCSADDAAPRRVEGVFNSEAQGSVRSPPDRRRVRRLDRGVTRFTAAAGDLLPAPASPGARAPGSGPRPGLCVCPGHCHAGVPRAAGRCPSGLTAVGVVPRQAASAEACFSVITPPPSGPPSPRGPSARPRGLPSGIGVRSGAGSGGRGPPVHPGRPDEPLYRVRASRERRRRRLDGAALPGHGTDGCRRDQASVIASPSTEIR